jgi:hypothetical protein
VSRTKSCAGDAPAGEGKIDEIGIWMKACRYETRGEMTLVEYSATNVIITPRSQVEAEVKISGA